MNSKSEGWTLIIPADIDDIPCQAVIDTAAQVTVINEELYQRLKSSSDVIEHVNLKDVTARNMIPAKLLKSVDIKIGSKCYPWNIYVANIADEVILGLDFLRAKQGIVNLHRNELTLCNEVIPALLKRNTDGAQHQVSRVRLKKRLVLPPHTMKVQCGIVENDHLEMCSFSPTTSRKFISPHTIVQVSSTNEIPVCLWNPSDKFCTLKQNTIIGSCTEAELLPEFEPNHMVRSVKHIQTDINEPNTANCNDANTKKKNQLYDELPSYLREMFKKSCTHISDQEAEQFAKLLSEFKDAFASSDTDLGCFTAIKHKINTANATPVKQRMRRTPIGFQEEEEKHLKSMLECGVVTPSTSEWASAPVLVRKKDGSVCWCIDYRAVNDKTTKQTWLVPSFSQCEEMFSNLEYMSTVDVCSGYWQIEVEKKTITRQHSLQKFIT